MIRVLIVDDNPLVRKSCRALLNREGDLAIVGQARDGFEALECAQDLEPDVILMDIRMPRMDGLAAVAQMHALGYAPKVIIVSLYSDRAWVRAAIERGARGFILKRNAFQEMVEAIHTVAGGEVFLSPQVTLAQEVPASNGAQSVSVISNDIAQD